MKTYLAIWALFLLVFISPAKAQNDDSTINDYILEKVLSNGSLINKGISEVAYQRCLRFLTSPGQINSNFYVFGRGTVSLNTTRACSKSSSDLIKALDYHQEKVTIDEDTFFIRIVFKDRLEKLIKDPKTGAVLENIQFRLKQEYFNFYDSVDEILNSKEKTLEFLAVLFQDFSEQKLHFEYLNVVMEKNPHNVSKVFSKNMELLSKTLDLILEVSSGQPASIKVGNNAYRTQKIALYPSKSLLNFEKITSMAYHYWVPAYVAYLLSRQYGNSDVHSYLPAFSFNYFYEALFNEGLKLTKWSTIKQIFSFEDLIFKSKVKAYDVYLGHEGPFFALDYYDSKWPHAKFVKQIMERPFPAYHSAVQHIRY